MTFAQCFAQAGTGNSISTSQYKITVKIIPNLQQKIVSSSNTFVVTVTYLASRCGNGFATSLKYSQKFLEGKYRLHHCNGLALVSLQFPCEPRLRLQWIETYWTGSQIVTYPLCCRRPGLVWRRAETEQLHPGKKSSTSPPTPVQSQLTPARIFPPPPPVPTLFIQWKIFQNNMKLIQNIAIVSSVNPNRILQQKIVSTPTERMDHQRQSSTTPSHYHNNQRLPTIFSFNLRPVQVVSQQAPARQLQLRQLQQNPFNIPAIKIFL